jgi:hypothetical protein
MQLSDIIKPLALPDVGNLGNGSAFGTPGSMFQLVSISVPVSLFLIAPNVSRYSRYRGRFEAVCRYIDRLSMCSARSLWPIPARNTNPDIQRPYSIGLIRRSDFLRFMTTRFLASQIRPQSS